MFREGEAAAREQQQCRTGGRQPRAKAKTEEGSHGTGPVFPSTTEAGSAPCLWGFTPASTQAEMLLFPSLLGRADAGLAGERYIWCIWYHSPQVSGLFRYSGDQEEMSIYVSLLSTLTSHTLPFFQLQYKTWAGGMASEDWAPGAQQNPQTHNRAGVQSSSQLCWHPPSRQDKATEKSVGKDERAEMRFPAMWLQGQCQPIHPFLSQCPVPSWVLPPAHNYTGITVNPAWSLKWDSKPGCSALFGVSVWGPLNEPSEQNW